MNKLLTEPFASEYPEGVERPASITNITYCQYTKQASLKNDLTFQEVKLPFKGFCQPFPRESPYLNTKCL